MTDPKSGPPMRETCQGITCDCQSECRHDEHCPGCLDLHGGERADTGAPGDALPPARLEELERLHKQNRAPGASGADACRWYVTIDELFPALLAAAQERETLRNERDDAIAHMNDTLRPLVEELRKQLHRESENAATWEVRTIKAHEERDTLRQHVATLTAERDEARQHRSMSEEDWAYSVAAQAKVYAAVEFAKNVEAFIRALPWTTRASEYEQTLVAGNLRNFAARLLDAIREAE